MSMRSRISVGLAAAALLVSFSSLGRADVTLPAIFSSHMVLQQQMPVPVWGWAEKGEQVTVSLGEQKQTAVAGEDGKWQVKLAPLSAGGPFTLHVEGKNKVELDDVLVGEVWLCSGQSNMEMGVAMLKDPQQEIAAANYPKLRLYTVPRWVAGKPQTNVGPHPAHSDEGKWLTCTPKNITVGEWNGFSAAAYFFGRDLHKAMDVPVGVIHSSWGGTPAESWTPLRYLTADEQLEPIVQRWNDQIKGFERQVRELSTKLDDWREHGGDIDDIPAFPQDQRGNPWRPAGLYNGMIAPIVPFAIRGAAWYQGESNAGRAYQYRKLLPAMIQSWRDAFGEPEFPFLIVSLANFTKVQPQPGESDWAELREAQAMTAAQPHNAQALAIDIGDAMDIHPKDKQTVGARLALAAQAIAYGKEVEYSGPWYESMTVEGDAIRLHFRHMGGGLVSKGEPLKGFAIAGQDRAWHWADAKIDGDTVLVHSSEVPHPVAVRYAWANNPIATLYNKAGLPAVPFRTDDWKGVTADNR